VPDLDHCHSYTPDEKECETCGGHLYELDVDGRGNYVTVSAYIFRSWTGPRRLDGADYRGPVYLLGEEKVA
jgi:hypothetical protein